MSMSLSECSEIAFSELLLKKSDQEQQSAIIALQEYVTAYPDIWRPQQTEHKIFDGVLAWKPIANGMLGSRFNPVERLQRQPSPDQCRKIEALGFSVKTAPR